MALKQSSDIEFYSNLRHILGLLAPPRWLSLFSSVSSHMPLFSDHLPQNLLPGQEGHILQAKRRGGNDIIQHDYYPISEMVGVRSISHRVVLQLFLREDRLLVSHVADQPDWYWNNVGRSTSVASKRSLPLTPLLYFSTQIQVWTNMRLRLPNKLCKVYFFPVG